jgi:CheY-like chemotaxis protein
MGLLSFIHNTPPSQPDQNLEPPLPPTRSINASPKSALLVENDECLLNFLRRWLKDKGYAVRIASGSEEGLRLYRDFGPFNVVLINYCIPQRKGYGIDPLVPQTKGIDLALAIRDIDSSQGIIIAALAFRTAPEVPRPPEAMHIPLLVDLGGATLRGLLEKIEVDRAIKALTPADLLRLQRFAKLLVQGLGRAARGRDWEDLLEEALYRTLIGAGDTQSGRHWNRTVPFVQHLAGAVKSIASVWKRQLREKEPYLMSELAVYDAEGQEHSPIDGAPSSCVPADRRLIEKAEEERAFALLRDDASASQVLQGIIDGLKKNDIKLAYGLDEKKYLAAMRRIRVKLLGRNRGGNDNGRG